MISLTPLPIIEEVVRLFRARNSKSYIARELKLGWTTVQRLIKTYDVPGKTCKEIHHIISGIEENFFEVIDTEAKAYFLGLLYADGCVYRGYRIYLGLTEPDKYLIEQFRKYVAPNNKIEFHKREKPRQNQYRLVISSRKMAQDLIKLGCTEKKSLTLK